MPDHTFTVGELNRLIQQTLALTFPDEMWVEGEISSLKRHEASGHVYFELLDVGEGRSDPNATLQVALFRSNKDAVNNRLRRANHANPGASMRMTDGIHIRLRGALDYQPASGRLRLRMTAIDPAHTLGRLLAERDRVLARLLVDGLLERNRQVTFPLLPLHIGLITSEGSAAHADFVDELVASGYGWQISLASSPVQGPGADRSIVAAILTLAERGVDLIALVRGGGARTDLLPFDSDIVARTIASSPVPVLTGIGHEIDVSVADRVAARAFKTPTACAAFLVDHLRTTIDSAERSWDSIAALGAARLERHEQALVTTGARVVASTRARLVRCEERLSGDADRVRRSATTTLQGAHHRIAVDAARVDAVDPRRALARGWSITRKADGSVLRDLDQLELDDELVTTLATGSVRSRVVAGSAATQDDGGVHDPRPDERT